MPDIVKLLLGPPNERLSRVGHLRYGTNGSLSVDLVNGQWFDHEAQIGGGALDLIVRERGGAKAEAWRWLEEQRLVSALSGNVIPIRPKGQNTSAFYDYADENGEVRYRVERTLEKEFRQHGPDGKGGFHSAPGCMKNVERIPYRLPELLAADPDKFILIVEGEKHCDELAGLGFVATTNAGGASKWGDGWGKRYFAGRSVIILPDNDEPGRTHGAKIAADLKGHAAAIVTLELPGLPPKGDVIDWLAAGGTASALVELAGNCLALGSGDDIRRSLINPASWDGKEPPDREWAWEEMLPMHQTTLLTGAGSAGKSLLGQQLATCAAVGLPILGLSTAKAVAIYVTCEDDADELHRRQRTISEAAGVDFAELDERLWLLPLAGELGNELATFDRDGTMSETRRFGEILAMAKSTGTKLLILDNTAHLFSGNENDRHQVAAFVNLLNRLAREIGGAVLLIGHPNKNGDEFSGSTAWENQVRSRLYLEIPGREGEHPDPNARTLKRSKANYAKRGGDISFHWHNMAFVRKEDLPDAGAALASALVEANEERRFLEILDELTKQQRNVSESANAKNYAPKFMASLPDVIERKLALERAMNRLFAKGEILAKQELWRGPDRKCVLGIARKSPR